MEKIAIYPGTFDPITFGHIDIIERAATIFDKVVVVIGINSSKKTLFSIDERIDMAKYALRNFSHVEVVTYNGLTIDIARDLNAVAIIRGVRSVTDFDYEFAITLANRSIEDSIQTIFMMPDSKYTYLSSSIVREFASYGEDISNFVPQNVAEFLYSKFYKNKQNTTEFI